MSGSAIFLKQYGAKRTGTNYLRALLAANYENATVLMHVLGDKHSSPVDLCALRTATRACDRPEEAFVRAATRAAPAETSQDDCPLQQDHIARLALPLTNAFDEDRLCFLISIRHPRRWAFGLARYHRHCFVSGSKSFGLELADFLRDACLAYNRNYEAWWQHHQRFEGRSAIIRHEDLVRDSRQTVEPWAGRWGLVRKAGEWKSIPERVCPAEWDQDDLRCTAYRFDGEFYCTEAYRKQVSPELWRVLEQVIDWKLMACFGYEPESRLWYRWAGVIYGASRFFKRSN